MDESNKYTIIIILVLVLAALVPAVASVLMVKRHPKTYGVINHTIILYPYYYMIYIAVFLIVMANGSHLSVEAQEMSLAIIILVTPVTIGTLIADFIINAHHYVGQEKLARLNMIIKLVHIPAYITHFVLGLLGSVASVWGIGIILWAIIVDLVTIAISGTHALTCVIGISKHKVVKKSVLIAAAILSYIYCVDVVVSIVFYIMVRKGSKTLTEQETSLTTLQ